MEYNVGDKVILKKKHPCGSNKCELIRVGVDFKFKCLGCNHIIMLPREKAVKIIKNKEE